MGLICEKARALAEKYAEAAFEPALSIAAMKNGEREFLRAENSRLVSGEDTRAYEYCSITKTFTGSLLCKLLSEKKISLTDRVSDYIKGLPEGYYYPTIAQLATHTAGYGETLPLADGSLLFPCDRPDIASVNLFERYTEADVDTFAANARLTQERFEPVYSNLGITILARIIGIIEGVSAREALERFFKTDLKLEGITLGRPASNYVTGRDENGADCGNWLWGETPFVCMGGLYGSARALLDYAEHQLENKPPYLALGHEPRERCFERGAMTGLCWLIYERDGIVWHNGGTGCFKTFFGFCKRKNAAVAVLSNQKARGGVTSEEIGLEILRGI